ncbi:STAS domain-containing protein [Polluticoccus soli]|uniref:STAS domain-containing protein n=1 Tax=Polluticoccus soli TaxID=3034150 RepID=UPI0023E22C4B|nr:STAS domain-containing protein [Flavipsychrobacter sp. JY13-12]
MEFKIDTNPTYIQITPVFNSLNANLSGSLREKWTELTQSGSQNFIIDLSNCTTADKDGLEQLVELHAECYSNGQSLVFTGVQGGVLQLMKDTEIDMAINIAPTQVEAVDIISMEILERDLFNEE